MLDRDCKLIREISPPASSVLGHLPQRREFGRHGAVSVTVHNNNLPKYHIANGVAKLSFLLLLSGQPQTKNRVGFNTLTRVELVLVQLHDVLVPAPGC